MNNTGLGGGVNPNMLGNSMGNFPMMNPQFQMMMGGMQGGMNNFGMNNIPGMGGMGGMTGSLNNSVNMGGNMSMGNFGNPAFGMGLGGINNSGMNMGGMGMGLPDQNQMMMNMMMMNQMNQMNQMGPLSNMNQMNQSGMMQANLANIAQLEQQRIQEEEERNKKEKEDLEKELNEEIQKLLQEKREQNIIRPIETIIVQPELFFDRDRFFYEELFIQPLITEGIFGMENVKLDKKKILGDKGEISPQMDEDYFEKMKVDGCYIDIIKKQINSYNLQKVEQRCLREGKYDWFKLNGDLKLENDIFVDQFFKPLDISLTINDKLLMRTLSASLCQKTSSRNFKTFNMKIFISKVVFLDHPLFSEEDHSAIAVKEAYKNYYSEMNQLVIPFLKQKIESITKELEAYSKIRNPSDAIKEEIRNMRIFVDESLNFLEEKKKLLNEKGNELYNRWLELKNIRTKQVFQSTNVKLNVLRFPSLYKDNPHIYDYAFVMTYLEPTTDKERLGSKEVERRENVKKYKIYLKIYVNDVFVAKSKTYELKWPNFEAELNNLFELTVFSRPTKIEIEVYMGTFLFDVVSRFEIEAPGIFMNTITSSTSLFEEIDFENTELIKNANNQDLNKEVEISNKIDGKNEEDAKLLADNQIQIKNEKAEKKKIRGRLLVKAEWDGNGPELPPTKIENKIDLIQKQKEFKKKLQQIKKYDYPFDLNDPRNVEFFELMKKMKTEMFLKYLNKEYLLPLYDIDALRHYLYQKRVEKLSLKTLRIPILEREIEEDKELIQVINNLLREESPLNPEDYDNKVKEKLESIYTIYSGRVLSEEEYFQMLSKKVRIMKRDLVTRQQSSYKQVISEFEIGPDAAEFCIDFLKALFTPPRKMKPKRIKKLAEKIEKCSEINISIHIVKGYNVPVRNYSTPYALRELRKKGYILDVYKSGIGLGLGGQQFMNNSRRNNDLNMSGGFNQGNFNQFAMMQQGNMMMNPSFAGQLYNLPGAYMGGGMRKERYDDIFELVEDLDREERNVESFVQIRMIYYDQEMEQRTDSISGVHPDYNYKFQFKIKPKNGEKYFTREEMGKTTGAFYFTLYDEVRIDSRITEKVANTYSYRFEKKYLGSFNIPFSTIFQNTSSMLESMCRVTVPLTVFGYYSDVSSHYVHEEQSNQENAEESKQDNKKKADEDFPKIVNPNINTYISLYVTIDPVIETFVGDEVDYVPGFEDSMFLINSMKVLKEYKAKSFLKTRHIKLFAENFDGYSVFISRYVKAQKPPDIVISDADPQDQFAIQKAARYVSLIPFIDDSQAFDEMPDCWCSSDQFFTLGFGDYEEHAVLLCNYFLYIESVQKKDISTFILLGKAHPEGDTTYVLRKHNKTHDIEIWNAKTGECYYFDKDFQTTKILCFSVYKHFVAQKNDLICQMKEVGCVISDQNVYINIQDTGDPAIMEFNFEDTKCWLPFLNEKSRLKYFRNGYVTSIQKELDYATPNNDEALELSEKILDFLKKKIEITRASYDNFGKPLRTRWERAVSQKRTIENLLFEYDTFFFRNFLPPLQLDKKILNNMKNEQENENVKRLYKLQKEIENEFPGVKEIYGFPMNISFTTLNKLWEDVRATDIHMVADEDSELGITVNVTAYPARIFSVWIFFYILKK